MKLGVVFPQTEIGSDPAAIKDYAQAAKQVGYHHLRQLAAGMQFLFSDLGETELRGFEDPVKLWELVWEAEGSP